MSASVVASSQSSPASSDIPNGFKSFWRKTERGPTNTDVQFVHQDPGTKLNIGKLGKLFSKSAPTPARSEASDDSGGVTKRRQQVYTAQKRHRNRKLEYVQSMEAEVARLQQLDSVVNKERNAIAHENARIKALLAAHSINLQLDSPDLHGYMAQEDLSMLGCAELDIRFDPLIEHTRVFADLDYDQTMLDASTQHLDVSNTSETQNSQRRLSFDKPIGTDSWAALDFILALEWPCQDHIEHQDINPEAVKNVACDVGLFNGHAFSTTQAVFSSALPPPGHQHQHVHSHNDHHSHHSGQHWQLPHSEIDKLVHLSEQLDLDDEQLTPAMAYAAVTKSLPEASMLRPILDALKVPLAKVVQCSGFGSWMSVDTFNQQFEEAVQQVMLTA